MLSKHTLAQENEALVDNPALGNGVFKATCSPTPCQRHTYLFRPAVFGGDFV